MLPRHGIIAVLVRVQSVNDGSTLTSEMRSWPDDPSKTVSHETIYTALYVMPRGGLRKDLIACLRHGRAKRRPRSRGQDRRGQIPDMLSLHVRPRSFPAIGKAI